MTKSVHNDVLDGSLNIVKNNANTMLLCAGAPTDRADALAKALADVAMAPGDFTVGDGDTNGRKVAVAAKNNVLVDTAGTGDHVSLIDGTRLLVVTSLSASKAVSVNDEVNFPTWDEEIADPT